MRCAKVTLISLALALFSCGGGGGGSGSQSSGSVVVTPPVVPPPPPPPARGAGIGAAALVPATLAGGGTAGTVEPGELKKLVDQSVVLGTTVTSTPVCAVTTY